VGSLDPDQGVQPVGLAPSEPLPQLVGVQAVGMPGLAGQVGHRRQLGVGHRRWLERQKGGRTGHGVTSRGDRTTAQTPLAANAARHPDRIDANPVPLVAAASAGGAKTHLQGGTVAPLECPLCRCSRRGRLITARRKIRARRQQSLDTPSDREEGTDGAMSQRVTSLFDSYRTEVGVLEGGCRGEKFANRG